MACAWRCRRCWWRPTKNVACARRRRRAGWRAWKRKRDCNGRCRLGGRRALESEHAVLEVDPDAVVLQELRADDPSELEPEQHARRVQIEHYDREIPVLDRVERQIHARQQERVLLPPGCTPHLQRNPAELALADGGGGG